MHTQSRIPVAVLGATGMVGQRFIELLQEHPWFELVGLAASEQHGGRAYAEVTRWRLPGSEMPASVATLPAISGAGYPGLPSYDVLDNAIPYIGGEEEKVETETLKMLGSWEEGVGFSVAPLVVSAHCNRVATREGHLECASVELGREVELEEIIATWESYTPEPQRLKLPSAPERALVYRSEPDRPQALRDRDAGQGMTVTLGRLRRCPILGYKFVMLGHNTIRGAAGGSILNAELCVSKGLL